MNDYAMLGAMGLVVITAIVSYYLGGKYKQASITSKENGQDKQNLVNQAVKLAKLHKKYNDIRNRLFSGVLEPRAQTDKPTQTSKAGKDQSTDTKG